MADPIYVKRFDRARQALQDLNDPAARLAAVRRCIAELEELESATVTTARAAGMTWKQIGALYGLSKQGAQQRFRRTKSGLSAATTPVPE